MPIMSIKIELCLVNVGFTRHVNNDWIKVQNLIKSGENTKFIGRLLKHLEIFYILNHQKQKESLEIHAIQQILNQIFLS